MTRRLVSDAEAKRVLAQASPLLPQTRRALLRACVDGDRLFQRHDRAGLRNEFRGWLASRPHCAWCRCSPCEKSSRAA
jgi:hypothetical protein